MSDGMAVGFVLLCFHSSPIAFISFRLGRFWCETHAVCGAVEVVGAQGTAGAALAMASAGYCGHRLCRAAANKNETAR
jgi:hypothetical protein